MVNLKFDEKYIEKYLCPEDTYITSVFGALSNGKVVQKGTYAKMARDEMVRFMAEENVTAPEKMKEFDPLGYEYAKELSTDTE